MCLIFYFIGSYPRSNEGEIITRGQEGNLSFEAAQEALYRGLGSPGPSSCSDQAGEEASKVGEAR